MLSRASRPALRGWEIRGPLLGPLGAGWAELSRFVAAWPGPPIAFERRIIIPRGSRKAREYLLGRGDGTLLGQSETAVSGELGHLTACVRNLTRASTLSAVRLEKVLAPEVADAVEGRFADPLGGDQETLHLLSGELLRAMKELRQDIGLSLLIASAASDQLVETRGRVLMERTAGGLMVDSAVVQHERGVVIRVRLFSAEVLPDSLLAVAGSLLTAPTQPGPESWHRAFGPQELDAARTSLRTLHPGTGDRVITDEALVPALAAAKVLGLPIRRWGPDEIPMPALRSNFPRRGALIGRAPSAGGRMRDVRLGWDELQGAHSWCVGGSGTGKSTLLCRVIEDGISSGRATLVIDPHRDLSELALGCVSRDQASEAILLDPLEADTPGLDLIPAASTADDAHRIAGTLADAFEELYNADQEEYVGPFFHEVITRSVELVLKTESLDGPPTLADIERLVRDESFRSALLSTLPRADELHGYWDEYRARVTSPYNRGEVQYVTSKLSSLTAGAAGRLVGRIPTYSLDEAIREGRLIVCCLPIGELGVRTARLIGRLLLTRLFGALSSQAKLPPEDRAPVSVVIDEAQYVADGKVLEALLSQSRKWNASLALGNQSPAQLSPRSRDAVLTNAQHLFGYRLPKEQALLLADRAEGAESLLPMLPNFKLLAISPDIKSVAGPAILDGPSPLGQRTQEVASTRRASLSRWGAGMGAAGDQSRELAGKEPGLEQIDVFDNPEDDAKVCKALVVSMVKQGTEWKSTTAPSLRLPRQALPLWKASVESLQDHEARMAFSLIKAGLFREAAEFLLHHVRFVQDQLD